MIQLNPELRKYIPLFNSWLSDYNFTLPLMQMRIQKMPVAITALLLNEMRKQGYSLHIMMQSDGPPYRGLERATNDLEEQESYPDRAIVLKYKAVNFRIDMREFPSQNNAVDMALASSPQDKIRTKKVSDNQFNVLVESDDHYSIMLRLIALVPVLFKQLQIDDDVMEILESLAFWSGPKTSKLIKDYMEKIMPDFENSMKLNAIKSIVDSALSFTTTRRAELIDRRTAEIQNLRNQIRTLIEQNREDNYYILGVKSDNIDREELIHQILQIKNIKLFQKENSVRARITVQTPAHYDKEIAKMLITQGKENIFKHSDVLRNAFTKVFVDEEYTLYFRQPYYFDFNSGHVTAAELADQDLQFEGISNPHLQRFDCWGENDTAIAEALQTNHDYTYAVTLSTVAVGVLNFTDSTVISYFTDHIRDSDSMYHTTPCLKENSTGNWLTWKELFTQCES